MIERTRITSKELSDWAEGNRPKSLLKTLWLAIPDISIISGVSKSKIVNIANLGLLGMPKSYGTYCVQGHKMPMYAMDEIVEWLSKPDVTAKINKRLNPNKPMQGIDNAMAVNFLIRKRISS